MSSWARFEQDSKKLAEVGRRLFVGEDGVAIAFLATSDRSGKPGLSPVCPIFAGEGLYLSAASGTPKVQNLQTNGQFVLHAFLGEHDEEFQIAGRAKEVGDPAERSVVLHAISFPSFDRAHPIFRFGIQRALWVHWERAGQPDMKAIRERWSESGESS